MYQIKDDRNLLIYFDVDTTLEHPFSVLNLFQFAAFLPGIIPFFFYFSSSWKISFYTYKQIQNGATHIVYYYYGFEI